MKKRILYQVGIISTVIMTCAFTCKSTETRSADLLPESSYAINTGFFKGEGNNNASLKAIEVPCSNNNTIRIYYSPSANFTIDTVLTVVSSSRAGTLKAKECYVEVSTSVTDTWLSTGSTTAALKVSSGVTSGSTPKNYYKFTLPDVRVQHWTSIPLNEFGTTSAEISTLKF